jgi:hypothetical protein
MIDDDKVREALVPVLDWFQSDEHEARPTLDILRDVVAELQMDRQVSLKAMEACRKFLKACRCVDIHHHGFGSAFDAAMEATQLQVELGTESFARREGGAALSPRHD